LKWIGTQRTAFTHKKKQKRIKEVIEKTKENLKKAAEVPPVKKPEAVDEEMEDVKKTLTAFIIKN